ncbi:MAG: hypothetical protein ACYTGP_04460 [Planctomycetota bacterium]|jgi:4-hydroxybenzoate polyprenyltransferase
MAVPASFVRSASLRTDDEGAVHYFARESQLMLRWVVRCLLVVTAITMVTFWFWAILPATLLVITYLLLLLAREIERRSRRGRPAPEAEVAAPVASASSPAAAAEVKPEDLPAGDDETVSMPLLKHEVIVISSGVAAVMIIAIVLAAIFFGGAPALLAALFFFAYILLLGGPVWLAAFEDDIEDETHRLEEAAARTDA